MAISRFFTVLCKLALRRVAPLLAALALGTAGAAAADVALRADAWCPYNCEAGARPGYLVEIAKAALEPAGHKVSYAMMPWTKVLAAVKTGEVTGALGAVQTEAPELIYPKSPLGLSRPTLVIRRGKELAGLSDKNLDPLKSVRFGSITDYFYSEAVNAFIDANKSLPNMVRVSGDNVTEDLVNMLIEGKIDAMVEDSNVIDYLLESKGYRNLFSYVPLGEPSDVSIGFSPKDPNAKAYAELIDAKLAEMRKNGQLAQLLSRYGMRDWVR
ncbi:MULTISPECIES: ABC transporter substrate-binding protein [unclassified Azospirillum]|uniref:substrate-binding periplasmic protein n=1 Tax=unclassified Azospirillum TaxID=2630922 RepID=UPI000B733BDB|nr:MULTISPECIES: transporter substrate-binding domain-containing protein [unclassified Azospirillum]SNS63013.1 amino acid ABC transporter substrate-binding protein, PAAT family [Azospirillum sp. RU38E]SNS82137.1 amino acid ABC transporter substrate-binding protein, PAAT family [Azospirillum sp. RU37A]